MEVSQAAGAKLGALSHGAAPHLLSDSGLRSGCSAVAEPPSPEPQAGPKPVIPVPSPGQQLPRPLLPPPAPWWCWGGWGMVGAFRGHFKGRGAGMGRQKQPGRPHCPCCSFHQGEEGWEPGLHQPAPCRGLCWEAEQVEASREAEQGDRGQPPAVGASGPQRTPTSRGLEGVVGAPLRGALPSVGLWFPHPSKKVPQTSGWNWEASGMPWKVRAGMV